MKDWQQYERQIESQFRAAYPSARITWNARLLGKFSKIERQVDLLIEEQALDLAYRIIIDAKHYGRPIDIGDVEAFLGLAADVEAITGIMVAPEGYTEAAINRVHFDNQDIVLDILNFQELKDFQGQAAIPFAGNIGVSIAAPFGWIADARQREGMVATLYQRGLTYSEAVQNGEFMYINFWSKERDEINSLDALLKFQETYMLTDGADSEIQFLDGPKNQRAGARTLIRRFEKKSFPIPELTGFIDFDKFIFMCVLFTPKALERKNLMKLRYLLRDAIPVDISKHYAALIRMASLRLNDAISESERASVLSDVGQWNRQAGRFQEAREALEASLNLAPGNYETITRLLSTLTHLGDKAAKMELLRRLLRLDPHNPTVFDDCIKSSSDSLISKSDAISLFDVLPLDYPGDELIEANCHFYAGKLLLDIDPAEAIRRMRLAQTLFESVFPAEHEVFAVLSSAIAGVPSADTAAGTPSDH